MDIINPAVDDYLLTHCTPADDLLRQLADETREAFPGAAGMQVSHDEGELLTMLTRLAGARHAVEVGTFTGYSSICIARGLARGRPPALLRRQRGVDLDRPALLGAGRRRGPDRAADRPGARHAAGAARRAGPRPRVHRRRQARLPALLRGDRQPPAPRRPPHPRQCAARRPGAGPGLPGRRRCGHASDERDHRRRRSRGVGDAARTRWRHPRPQTLTPRPPSPATRQPALASLCAQTAVQGTSTLARLRQALPKGTGSPGLCHSECSP